MENNDEGKMTSKKSNNLRSKIKWVVPEIAGIIKSSIIIQVISELEQKISVQIREEIHTETRKKLAKKTIELEFRKKLENQ